MEMVVEDKMARAGRQCRWLLEEAGLLPTQALTEAQTPGLVEALTEAMQALTPSKRVGLWMVALAWGGME
jgi:hypothetical protein